MLITLILAVFSEMLTVISWDSLCGGRWKSCDMRLHAGCNQSMWMGVCGMSDLDASPGQMSVIPDDTAVIGEVIIQTFGAIGVSMLTILAFLICSEHLLWILALSLVYKADMQVGGLASDRRGVFKLQNCPLAFWHVLN